MAAKTDALEALSPQQVNSWPSGNESDFTVTGEPLRYFGASSEQSFLDLAFERFRVCVDATEIQRRETGIDKQFAAGQQWDPDIEGRRNQQKRPCLTINRIDGFLAHAVNSFRQSRPQIKIVAAADGADEDIAEVKQGLIRHIQSQSTADTVYDESFRHMCTGGIGWIRVVDDWSDPTSMDQDLFIRLVNNPATVYFDPFCRQPDWSDGRFAFVVEDLTLQQFKAKFGADRETASLTNFSSLGDTQKSWFVGGNIRVAEYFHVEMKDDKLCELEDKSTRLLSELPKGMYSVEQNAITGVLGTYLSSPEQKNSGEQGQYVGRARKCKVPEVYWALITAVEVLKERKWKGRFIPLIPVLGNSYEVDEQKILAGMVRYAREPQRMYNYMYTCFVETVALVPRAAWVAEINQLPDGGILDSWQRSNTDPQTVLRYKGAIGEDGKQFAPPSRQVAEPPIAAFVQGLQMADQNLKSVFRIFDASLGQRGPQESGLAINARKVESDTGIYNWADNFIRSLEHLGKVLDDLLPSYYNTEGRVFEIIQEDDTRKRVVMNQIFEEAGQQKQYDLSKGGKYAVVISTGPSYQTKRQEAAANMIDFFKIYPAGLAACAHILVEEMDFAGKDKLRKQLEKILPQQLQEPDPDNMPDPMKLQQQNAQLQAMVQQLSTAVHELSDKRETERMKQEFETFRELISGQVSLVSADIKAASAESQVLSQQLFGQIERLLSIHQANAEQAANPPVPAGGQAPAPSLAGGQTAGPEQSVGG